MRNKRTQGQRAGKEKRQEERGGEERRGGEKKERMKEEIKGRGKKSQSNYKTIISRATK